MNVLAVILARAGSKGLRDKCVRPLLGRPLIEYSFDHVLDSACINETVLTTDSAAAADLAGARGIRVVDRPAALATDTAPVDAVARHALTQVENDGCAVDVVLLVYGNIPVRAPGILDRAVDHLISTGADSVRSVAAVGKHHPDWLHALDGDRMIQFRPNSIHRRQDLDSLYYHDGAAVVVTRDSLIAAAEHPEDHHAFFGRDRRGLVQSPEDTVDVDGIIDLYVAEAILRSRRDSECHGVTLQ